MAWPTHIVAAGGYVFDAQGRMLLVKTHHRGWVCPGGQIETGEDLEEGLLREILEESGIRATVRSLAGVCSNIGQHLFYDDVTNVPTKVMFDFICDYVEGVPTPSDETSDVMWVEREKVLAHISSPPERYRCEKVLSFSGKVFYSAYISKPEFKIVKERWF